MANFLRVCSTLWLCGTLGAFAQGEKLNVFYVFKVILFVFNLCNSCLINLEMTAMHH